MKNSRSLEKRTGAISVKMALSIAVRPESVRLHLDSGPSVSAEVVGLEFRGIYKLVRVRLPSGMMLSAVMGVHIPAPVGETVQVAVNAPVSAFPT